MHNRSEWAAMNSSDQFHYLADLLREKNLYALAVNEGSWREMEGAGCAA